MKIRRASHSNSWYTGDVRELDSQLSTWLDNASFAHGPAKAIISPHAGYSYSGPCAAHAFKNINPETVDRIFILGPSHHLYLNNSCALTVADYLETPSLVCKILKKSGEFVDLKLSDDENEHSLEMQMPYVAKVMEKYAFTVVPIMVGSLSFERERVYGEILAPYLQDPRTLFVISSDFCHWGNRFRYTYYDEKHGEIWQSIKNLDKMGMDSIETMNPHAFDAYMKNYRNTICGCHPIGVLLHAIDTLHNTQQGLSFSLKFVQYAQSNKCHSERDSSVSYASASVVTN
ncbi:unnamed protein product [Schistocephalus solidus]|uniref:Protein MEMO1 n=1 Tax=Schistocephalus solidus TaxID=70667 RepID=A0A183TAU4_SCHSO|nr:unnamed protein product [Schistocephalus solidus]